MSKKATKISNAAHIKRHTVGTSNELSFSVLDAAKNKADAEEGKEGKSSATDFLGSINVLGGSSRTGVSSRTPGRGSGASSFPYASSEVEIVRRKTRRRHHRVFVIATASIIGVALLFSGGLYLYSETIRHQAQVSVLDRALNKIAETDSMLLSMDQAITKPNENISADLMNTLIEKIPEAHQQLSDAKNLVEEADSEMRESADKEAARRALATIESREEMLTLGQQLLSAHIQKIQDTEALNTAWSLVLQADAVAREAATLVTNTTPENVTASREKSVQAQQSFDDARYRLEELVESPSSPDLQALINYAVKRSEAMGYAILSDDAILRQDRSVAQSQNDAYNAAENEAAAMAKELPDEKTQLITQAYDKVTKDVRERYMQVRSKLSTADAFLRDYLGT